MRSKIVSIVENYILDYLYVNMNVEGVPLGEVVKIFGEMIEFLCVLFMTWFFMNANIYAF